MESTTYLKNIRIAPKKLRFLQHDLKKYAPTQALEVLRYTPRHSARIWRKALQTAINNAKQSLKVTENMLELKALAVDQGYVLKRYRAGARGTAKSIKKRFSHIKIVLGTKNEAPAIAAKPAAAETKKGEKKVAVSSLAHTHDEEKPKLKPKRKTSVTSTPKKSV